MKSQQGQNLAFLVEKPSIVSSTGQRIRYKLQFLILEHESRLAERKVARKVERPEDIHASVDVFGHEPDEDNAGLEVHAVMAIAQEFLVRAIRRDSEVQDFTVMQHL